MRLGLLLLLLQHRELFLVGDRIGLSCSKGCLGSEEIGPVLLCLLDRDRAAINEALISLVLLFGEGEGRLRLGGLLFGLVDACLLAAKLSVGMSNICPILIDLRPGLIDLCLVVAGVQAYQDGSSDNELVVRYQDVDNGRVDL